MSEDTETIIYFEKFPEYTSTSDNIHDVSNDNSEKKSQSKWSMDYYKQYFDIETSDIEERILSSMILYRNESYKRTIQCRPDIYGPFWISITLIFSTVYSCLILDHLRYPDLRFNWNYELKLLSQATFIIFLYVCLVPTIFWSIVIATMKDQQEDLMPRIFEFICFYGYSLAIFVPISILWTIQMSILQWILAFVAAGLSGMVLCKTLTSSFHLSKYPILLQIGCVCCHLLLTVVFSFMHQTNIN